jgi:hypothetical protein
VNGSYSFSKYKKGYLHIILSVLRTKNRQKKGFEINLVNLYLNKMNKKGSKMLPFFSLFVCILVLKALILPYL